MEKMVATTAGSRPITTFVQTDTISFREVVQRLTGSSENTGPSLEDAGSPGSEASPGKTKRPTASLHERRQHTRQRLEISKPNVLRFGPGIDSAGSLISPLTSSSSMSGLAGTAAAATPTSSFSKLSIAERRSRPPLLINAEEEERAIKERRFYLHPSPRSRAMKAQEPELLNLFPLRSPTGGGPLTK